jgi:hypothetical protein
MSSRSRVGHSSGPDGLAEPGEECVRIDDRLGGRVCRQPRFIPRYQSSTMHTWTYTRRAPPGRHSTTPRFARLTARIVAGAANNQLESLRHGDVLRDRGITCVPDFIANAGGAIYLCRVLAGWSAEQVSAAVEAIFDASVDVLERGAGGDLDAARGGAAGGSQVGVGS